MRLYASGSETLTMQLRHNEAAPDFIYILSLIVFPLSFLLYFQAVSYETGSSDDMTKKL